MKLAAEAKALALKVGCLFKSNEPLEALSELRNNFQKKLDAISPDDAAARQKLAGEFLGACIGLGMKPRRFVTIVPLDGGGFRLGVSGLRL